MKKEIEFIASSEDVERFVSVPEPANLNVPDWYKKSFKFKKSNTPSFDKDNFPENTIKSCIPVLDSITSGYIQKTWCDIYIENFGSEIIFRWSSSPQIIFEREDFHRQDLPVPIGHNKKIYSWSRPWGIKTPKGYSCLFINPSYRDLPFTCYPGIIDTDTYHSSGTRSVPFFIKEGFSGLIPSGTPMYQIIPFKRDSWKSVKREYGYKDLIKNSETKLFSKFYDRYKKNFWQRKTYE